MVTGSCFYSPPVGHALHFEKRCTTRTHSGLTEKEIKSWIVLYFVCLQVSIPQKPMEEWSSSQI